MVLTVMVVGLFMNAAVTRAFTTSGWAFVIPLVLIQVGRTVWTVVNASDPIFREHFSRALVWFVAMSPLWVVGAAVNPERRLVWWALAAGIDQIGAWLAHPLPGRRLHTEQFTFAGGHMLERCRLFLIIALGETVLTAGMALADAPLTLATIASGVAALVGTIALWTLGFGRAGQLTLRYMEETRDPARASRHAVSVLMVMVAGLIAVAVANEASIAHPREHMSTGVRLLLTGGPMLYLLAQGWYYHVLLRVRPLLRLIGTTALGLLGIATLTVPTYIVLILFAASLSFHAVLDRP